MKIINKQSLEELELNFIKSENKIMKLLHHPNCIKLIENITTKNNIYIVTELIRNGELFDYIKNKKFVEGKQNRSCTVCDYS